MLTLIMECFFWFVTTILINMPKISGENSSQNKKNEAIVHKNSDLFQISKDILRSKRPTQQPRMKTASLKFALITTLTINLSAKSVKAEIPMNEPTKFIQELLPQIDFPIGEKSIFQQNQLKNHNLKNSYSEISDQHFRYLPDLLSPAANHLYLLPLQPTLNHNLLKKAYSVVSEKAINNYN